MLVIFVHGWSVTDTSTYGRLPEALAKQANKYNLDIEVKHIWLGRYISFYDDISISDVARAFNSALIDLSGDDAITDFSCITHSTGGPVVREWLNRFYGASNLSQSPLRHLVMLAPANHGSSLAALGKKRLGRINAWFSGIEPGQRILDWLSLGSQQQIDLAESFLEYKSAASNFYPYVLTGQTIDKKLYDFVNSYLVEAGSDGVVRVAGANLNYSMIKLVETKDVETVLRGSEEIQVNILDQNGELKRPPFVPLGIIPGASHSGDTKGIMRSVVSLKSKKKPQVDEILKCLTINSKQDYINRGKELMDLTTKTQQRSHRYMMLVFVIKDDQGYPVTDFELFLLGGDSHSPDQLSKGFFIDRQQNSTHRNHLVYYIDYDVITRNKLTGFRVIAHPSEGFVFYHAVEYNSHSVDINSLLKPNETFYVEVTLRRRIDKNMFGFDNATDPKLRKEGLIFKSETRHDFK